MLGVAGNEPINSAVADIITRGNVVSQTDTISSVATKVQETARTVVSECELTEEHREHLKVDFLLAGYEQDQDGTISPRGFYCKAGNNFLPIAISKTTWDYGLIGNTAAIACANFFLHHFWKEDLSLEATKMLAAVIIHEANVTCPSVDRDLQMAVLSPGSGCDEVEKEERAKLTISAAELNWEEKLRDSITSYNAAVPGQSTGSSPSNANTASRAHN